MNVTKPQTPPSLYWGEDGLVKAKECLACRGRLLSSIHDNLDDLLGKLPGTWQFLQCASCGSLTLDPQPCPEAIGKAYPADYVTHSSGDQSLTQDNGTGVIWSACNGYLNKRFGASRVPASSNLAKFIPFIPPLRLQLDYFYRHLPRKAGTLLDVGCGNAAFLVRAREAGWKVRGLEPDSQAVIAARSNGVEVAQSSIMDFSSDGEFDQVTLSHVLEHLHEPLPSLQRILGWLKPGGRIWLALPNPDGLGHKIFGSNWFSLDPPRHLCIPTQKRLRQLLEEAGYVDVRLIRRGRGSRNSINPSIDYSKKRTGNSPIGARLIPSCIDLLSSLHTQFSEETVITGYKPK